MGEWKDGMWTPTREDVIMGLLLGLLGATIFCFGVIWGYMWGRS